MPDGGRLLPACAIEPSDGAGPSVLARRRTRAAASPPSELDGIFQPFRSSFEKGTGLGLAIVHRIVTDYSGTIQVSSTRRRGTTDARAPAGRAGSTRRAELSRELTEAAS